MTIAKPSLEVAINRSWLLVSWEVLHDFQPFIGGSTLFFWATGTLHSGGMW
jgi:hypothetical protein